MSKVIENKVATDFESDTTQQESDELAQLRKKQQQTFNRISQRAPFNEYNTSDPLVGPQTAGMAPGPMAMGASMKLHTRLAINLFRGRKGEPEKGTRPIIGLARFGREVAKVWTASERDDPFADQTLINVEIAYEQAVRKINSDIESLEQLISAYEDFDVDIKTSEQPVELKLQFYSPWGYRAALLLIRFDKLIRMALTARHLGLFVDSDWTRVAHESQRALRHMFYEVDSWIHTGVKRSDIAAGNRIAKRAQSMYMELKKGYLVLDQDVMEGRHRAQLSPSNRTLEDPAQQTSATTVQKKQATADKKTQAEAEAVTKTAENGDSVPSSRKLRQDNE